MIEVNPEGAERYQFSHGLIQQVLSQELSPSRRARLHARIGEALEYLHRDDLNYHAAELAHHFGEAQTVVGVEMLIRFSSLAGHQALASYAYNEALDHFQTALSAKGISNVGMQPAEDADAAALLFGLGRAQAATLGRHETQFAVMSLSRALDYYIETKNIAQVVAIAEYPIPPLPGHPMGSSHPVAKALGSVPTGSVEAGRLPSRYGSVLGIEEADYDGAKRAITEALIIARREHDAELKTMAVGTDAEVDWWHLRWRDCIQKSLETIKAARLAGNLYYEVRGHTRGLAGKPLAEFRATPSRRIPVLCGMEVYVSRFNNQLLHL